MDASAALPRRFRKVRSASIALLNEYSTDFDGAATAGYVSIADSAAMEPAAAGTWCVWMVEDTSLKTQDEIINKYNPGVSSAIMIRKSGNSSRFQTFVANASNDNSTTYGQSTSNVPGLAAGTWGQLCVVYDGSGGANADRLKMFYNGVEHALTFAGTIPATIQDTSHEWGIGGRTIGTLQFGPGNIDEVGFYNIAMTQAQITETYNLGVPANLAALSSSGGLVSWYRMGDGDTYPTILDNAGSAQNGTMESNLAGSDFQLNVP
jgi:hypothetical protein